MIDRNFPSAKDRQMGPINVIRADHVKRYEFAASKVRSRILDAACGCGYGSKILHDAGNQVVGIDIHQPAIDYAGEHYPGPEYICSDILKKPWVGMFDAVVSFETIEHLKEPEKALKLFRESTKGLFICSVPNENLYPFDKKTFEEEQYPHLRHYTPDEFEALLKEAGFSIEERHCQKTKDGQIFEGTEGRFLVYACR